MTVSPSIPATVQMRRSRLLGLLATVAVVAAAVTWAAFAASEGSSRSGRPVGSETTSSVLAPLTPSEKRYVQGISSMSRVQQAAAFGGHGGVIDALGLDARDAAYVKAIVSLTPAQMTGGFGTSR
jgi:hypothetical protein